MVLSGIINGVPPLRNLLSVVVLAAAIMLGIWLILNGYGGSDFGR